MFFHVSALVFDTIKLQTGKHWKWFLFFQQNPKRIFRLKEMKERDWFRLILVLCFCVSNPFRLKKLIRNMASGGLMFSFCAKFCVCLSHARTASGFSQFNQQNRNRNAKNPPILIDPRGIYVAKNECETTAGCMICLLNIPCSIRNIAKNKTLRILVCLSTWERAQGENGSRLKKNN